MVEIRLFNCVICNKQVQTTSAWKKCCSSECRKKWDKIRVKKHWNEKNIEYKMNEIGLFVDSFFPSTEKFIRSMKRLDIPFFVRSGWIHCDIKLKDKLFIKGHRLCVKKENGTYCCRLGGRSKYREIIFEPPKKPK